MAKKKEIHLDLPPEELLFLWATAHYAEVDLNGFVNGLLIRSLAQGDPKYKKALIKKYKKEIGTGRV